MLKSSCRVTENDCQEILANYFGEKKVFKISSFSTEPISNSVGFMCEHNILKITIEEKCETTELSFFLKLFIKENETIAEFVKSGNLFNKEIACYKFFDYFRTHYHNIDTGFAPQYYYSKDSDLLVLENLSATGYKIWDSVRLDVDHIKIILTAIAKFHSISLIFEEIKSKELGRKYVLTEDYAEYLQESLLKNEKDYPGYKYIKSGLKAIHTLIDQIPTKIPRSEFKAKVSALAIQAFEDIKPSTDFRNVLSHGDLWIKNVMFQYKNDVPVNCKIFDFQFLRYAPPAQDVLLMIYDSADKKIYQDHLDELLKHYFENLTNEVKQMGFYLKSIISAEEFNNSIPKIFPTVKLIKSIHKSISGTICNEIIFGDPCMHVIQAFQTQESYRTLMTSIIEELEMVVTSMS